MHVSHFISRLLLAVLVLCGGVAWYVAASNRGATEFYFHHDHVLGTSLDLHAVAVDEATAEIAETAVLDEVERLRRIFSLYDPESELSRLNRTAGEFAASPELIEVLHHYEHFQAISGGAFNGQLGELVRVWTDAEKADRLPDEAVLSRIVHQVRQPGWRIDGAAHTITRLTDQPLNLNSVAKGFIIGRAMAAAREKAPTLRGLLINLGGDMAAWGVDEDGQRDWRIGVQDPAAPHDNGPVLAQVKLRDRAIATSGGYERFYLIQGKRHSHLFDPRTGRSAESIAGATVIAADNVTANALATTLCILPPEEGLRLIAKTPGTDCLIVTREGKQVRSPGFAGMEFAMVAHVGDLVGQVGGAMVGQAPKAKAWPAGYQVNLSITLPKITDTKKYRKPYVAVWIENESNEPIRTITVWGNSNRYWKDLPKWWAFAKSDNALVRAVTKATRPPGAYSVVWDGKNDKGIAVGQGTFNVFVEVHREHGKLVRQTGTIECLAKAATITLDANAETGDTVINYTNKKK